MYANGQVWITQGDIILLSLRDFQDDKADVIHRYTPDEARSLKTYGELKSDFQINEGGDGESLRQRAMEYSNRTEGGFSDEEGGVEFEEAEIDDICGFRTAISNTDPPETVAITRTVTFAFAAPVDPSIRICVRMVAAASLRQVAGSSLHMARLCVAML